MRWHAVQLYRDHKLRDWDESTLKQVAAGVWNDATNGRTQPCRWRMGELVRHLETRLLALQEPPTLH